MAAPPPAARSAHQWATDVLAPATDGERDAGPSPSETLSQFASLLLDGFIMQMVVDAPGFDLPAALANARHSLVIAAARRS